MTYQVTFITEEAICDEHGNFVNLEYTELKSLEVKANSKKQAYELAGSAIIRKYNPAGWIISSITKK